MNCDFPTMSARASLGEGFWGSFFDFVLEKYVFVIVFLLFLDSFRDWFRFM